MTEGARRPKGAKVGLAACNRQGPDAYLIVAAGQRLYAPTLEELAEIAEYAARAGDPIQLLYARTPRG